MYVLTKHWLTDRYRGRNSDLDVNRDVDKKLIADKIDFNWLYIYLVYFTTL